MFHRENSRCVLSFVSFYGRRFRCLSLKTEPHKCHLFKDSKNWYTSSKSALSMHLPPVAGSLKTSLPRSCRYSDDTTAGKDPEIFEDDIYPTYVPRNGESVEVKRARLLYQSRKRGMLENGLLLSTFARAHLHSFTPSQLDLYDVIINRPSNDWQLYYWMVGKEETPADYDNEVMHMLKSHARNDGLEDRSRQPDLAQS